MKRHKPNGCAKARYPTEAVALEWLAIRQRETSLRRNRKQKGKRGPTNVYQCHRCGGWHLTSQTPGQPRPPRKAGPKKKRAAAPRQGHRPHVAPPRTTTPREGARHAP